jgi:hypothetical protein
MAEVFEGGHNDWDIVDISLGTSEEDEGDIQQEVFTTVLDTIAEIHSSEIDIGNTGAMSTEDDCEYYLIEFTSLPYRLEENKLLRNFVPPIQLLKGELVCDAIYLDLLPRAQRWYYRTDLPVCVRLQQVLAVDVLLTPMSRDNLLPRGYPQSMPPFDKTGRTPAQVTRLTCAEGCKKLEAFDQQKLLDEKRRREVLDHEEAEEETSVDENGNPSSSEEDDSNIESDEE